MSEIPELMSVEGRATLVGDLVNRVEYAGNPRARKEAVVKACAAHIRAAIEQERKQRASTIETVFEGQVEYEFQPEADNAP